MTTKVEGSSGIEFPDSSVQGSAAQLPSGMLANFAMNSAPSGWLACNGAAVSRTTYAALFAAIGTTWGAGDGSSTFNLPDMRGYFQRGAGTNSDGTAAGAFAAKQADEFKSHVHTLTGANTWNVLGGGSITMPDGFNTVPVVNSQPSGGAETRPKNIAVLTCIKV